MGWQAPHHRRRGCSKLLHVHAGVAHWGRGACYHRRWRADSCPPQVRHDEGRSQHWERRLDIHRLRGSPIRGASKIKHRRCGRRAGVVAVFNVEPWQPRRTWSWAMLGADGSHLWRMGHWSIGGMMTTTTTPTDSHLERSTSSMVFTEKITEGVQGFGTHVVVV